MNSFAPPNAGDPAERHKNTAICPLVTFPDGENTPGAVPEVTPASTSHATAVSKYEPAGTSLNPCGPGDAHDPPPTTGTAPASATGPTTGNTTKTPTNNPTDNTDRTKRPTITPTPSLSHPNHKRIMNNAI